MDPQTPPVGGKPANAYAGMRQNVAILAQDMIRLADLQIQLLTLDVAEFWKRARFGIVLCVSGAAVMLGSLPVLLMAAAEYTHSHSTLSMEVSQGAVAGIALVLAAGALLFSIRQLTKAGRSLQRSRSELQANMAWLRSVLNRDEE